MIFSVLGIEIKVEFLFTAVVALLCLIDKQGIMWISFCAVILHEVGHIVAMLLLKIRIRRIRLACCGVLIDGDSTLYWHKRLIIAASGPIMNIIIYLLMLQTDFGLISLVTGLFNLIPVSSTDGGDILRLVCNRLISEKISNVLFFVISLLFSSTMLVMGIMLAVTYGNPTLIAASVYFITMTIASVLN